MNLARFSVNRPVAAGIISVALLVLGLYFQTKMPVALFPEVNLPFVSVTVPMPGATPEQIEKKIIKPLEKELSAINGVKRVIATIKPGVGSVILGFKMSADPREAVNDVRDKVSVVRVQFPSDAEEAVISRIDMGAVPVIIYGINSEAPPEKTKKELEDGLVRTLQRIDGVNEAQVLGLGDEEVEISLDSAKLAALRIAPLDIFQQLAAYVKQIPWGDVERGASQITVARGALPASPEYWDGFAVTLADGRSVRLGEVGKAEIVRDADASLVRINGKPGLGLVVTKRAGANTLATVELIKKAVASMPAESGIKLFPLIDQSEHIKENAHEVWIALFAGGTFAVLVILFFLTDVRSALITATALPVSVAGAFIGMSMLGFSINMMSLLALALAIGLLIDDAVVVREAIFAEMEQGASAREAAVTGTDRVASAVLATTLAVVAVFLPVAMMDGIVGQFFKEFGLTIVIAVALSLWVAFTLDPMLSSVFGGKHQLLQGRFWDAWRRLLEKLEHGAARLGMWAFKSPMLVVSGAIILLVASSALVLSRGADFLAFEDRGQMIVNIVAPAGSTKEKTLAIADEVHKRLSRLEGLKEVYAATTKGDDARAEMRLKFNAKTERSKGLLEIQKEANALLGDVGAEVLVLEPPPVEGVGGEAPLAIYVYGEDPLAIENEATRVTAAINAIPGVAKARVETQMKAPGLDITIDPSQLGYYGTSAAAVEMSGRLALTGLEAGSVGDDNFPLFVRYRQEDRDLERLWNDTYVPTPKGAVLLSDLATSSDAMSPARIDREKRSRKAVIWGTLDRTRSYENVLADVEKVLQTIPAPLFGEVGGDKEMFEEMVSNFGIAIIGSAFFIFVILAIQLESLTRPFVILLTLPLALIGGFLALYLAGEKLALGALIGIILLIGLAAKNGILLVDAVGAKEKTLGLMRAVEGSVKERFRPILMTSVAMIFGMLPTAIMRGGGSEFRAPMAIAIIGGVISSTLLSVAIVPAIFGLIARVRAWRTARSGKTPEMVKSSASLVIATLVAGGMTLPGAHELRAEAVPAKAGASDFSQTKIPDADMSKVRAILASGLTAESKEQWTLRAAEASADDLSTASWLAFAGVLEAKASREWARPGITQAQTLPLPPEIGGPVNFEMVLLPKVQNVQQVSWGLPLINLQAIRGLAIGAKARQQHEWVSQLMRETAAQSRAQAILAHAMTSKAVLISEEKVRIATSRLRMVEGRTAAGVARPLAREEASAALEAARGELEMARAHKARSAAQLAAETGVTTEAAPGLPRFPLAPQARGLRALALGASESSQHLFEAQLAANDASFFPTLAAGAAYQRKDSGSPDDPKPQTILSLEVKWNLLDGGTRRRNAAEAHGGLFRAKAEHAATQKQLNIAFDTHPARLTGAKHNLAARKAYLRAASNAAEDAALAYTAGLGRLADVRTADEAKLNAELAVFQAEIELEGLALESLVLTNSLLEWLDSGRVPQA